jgi:hypothetical protein
MNSAGRRVRWFVGLYAASIGALAIITLVIKGFLRLAQ